MNHSQWLIVLSHCAEMANDYVVTNVIFNTLTLIIMQLRLYARIFYCPLNNVHRAAFFDS